MSAPKHFRAEIIPSTSWRRVSGSPAGEDNARVHLFPVTPEATNYVEWRLRLERTGNRSGKHGILGRIGRIGYATPTGQTEEVLALRLLHDNLPACEDHYAFADEAAESELPQIDLPENELPT